MKRDQAGKFTQTWQGEPKQAVKLSLTHTAWQLLEQQAQDLGVSRSELIERFARQSECCCTENWITQAEIVETTSTANSTNNEIPTDHQLQAQVFELQQTIEALRAQAQQTQTQTHEQQWLEAVLDLLPTPLILVDPEEKRVTFSNQAANAIAGVDLVKDVGATYNEEEYYCTDATGQFIPADQTPAVRAAQGEKIAGAEINWHTPVGVFPLLVYTDALPAMHDRPSTSVVVFQDISDRKQIEQELRESRRLIQQVADATPGILYIYDLIEQHNVYVNRQVGTVLGYTTEQIQEMGDRLFPALMHPDDLATLPAHMERFDRAQEGEVIEQEYRMRHVNGEWRWLWSRDLVFSRTQAGAPHQILGISHDITDRKQAELAAARSADRTARLQMVTAALSEALTPADVATVIMEQALAALGACRCLVALLKADGETLELVRSVGYSPKPEWQSLPVTAHVPLTHVIQTQTPLFFNSFDQMVVSYPQLAYLRNSVPAGAIAVIPLITENRVLGSLAIGFNQAQPINEEDQTFILTLARQCAQAIDRSQLYQAEQAARANAEASEQRFRFLAESIPQIVWVAQPGGFTEYYNQRWFQYTGLTLAESQNTNGSFRHPDDHAHVKAAWVKAVANRETFQAEQRLRRADGTYRWHLTRAHPLLGENGEILKWFGSCTDIDDWKRMEQKQRFLAQASQTFAAANLDLQTVLDTVTRLTSELTHDVCVLNLLAEDEQSLTHASFYHPDPYVCAFVGDLLDRYPRRINEGLGGRVMQTGEPLLMPVTSQTEFSAAIKPEYRLYLERFRVCSTLLLPLKLQGKPIGVLSLTRHAPADPHTEDDLNLFQDLADRAAMAISNARLYQQAEQARQRAEVANRTKDEFLAVLSHELRTPMNPILGWARLLQRGNLNPSQTTIALETIERNAKLQVQLIEDLLDVSRILQGKLSLNPCPVNLVPIINAAVGTVRLAAEAKAIQIHIQLEEIGQVLGDTARLQQVIWNLLSNAVKFTSEGGHIQIQLHRSDQQAFPSSPHASPPTSYAQIIVTDTGKGINPAFLPYVFDTFRQADSSITRTFGGLGLGLAIARHIVELHGGTIQVESLGEGHGSTFTVRLPLVSPAATTAKEPSLSNPSLTLQSVQILAVDDELDNLELAKFVLEQAGATVIAVPSAAEALESLAQTKPDLLLADIGMPQMDGYSLLKQVRALPPEHGGMIPAIALTAYAGEIDQQRALAVGFQKHLAKPIEPDELVMAVAHLTQRG